MVTLDKTGKSRLYLWIFLFSFILPLAVLNAEQIDAQRWMVRRGQSETITGPDGVCRKVTNNSASDIFVPIKTAAEWQAFLGHLPPGVTTSSCCSPIGCNGRCGFVDDGCGTMIDCGICMCWKWQWATFDWYGPADCTYANFVGCTDTTGSCACGANYWSTFVGFVGQDCSSMPNQCCAYALTYDSEHMIKCKQVPCS